MYPSWVSSRNFLKPSFLIPSCRMWQFSIYLKRNAVVQFSVHVFVTVCNNSLEFTGEELSLAGKQNMTMVLCSVLLAHLKILNISKLLS